VLLSPSQAFVCRQNACTQHTQEDFGAGDSAEMLRAYQEAEDFANNPDLLHRLTGAATRVRYFTLSDPLHRNARSHWHAHTAAVCALMR